MKPHMNKEVITALGLIQQLLLQTKGHLQAAHRIAQRAPRPSLAMDNLDYALREVIIRMRVLQDLADGGVRQHRFATGRAVGANVDIPEASLPQSGTSSNDSAQEPGRH